MGLIEDQKNWSKELKAKVKEFADKNNIRHVHAILELIRLIEYACEEMEEEMRVTVRDWACDDCDERRPDEPMRDESRD